MSKQMIKKSLLILYQCSVKYGASRVCSREAKPDGTFSNQVGTNIFGGLIFPLIYRVNLSYQIKWGQIPNIPICTVGSGSKLQQRFSNNDDITSGEEIVPQPNETRPCLTLDLKHLPSESTHFYLGPSFKPGLQPGLYPFLRMKVQLIEYFKFLIFSRSQRISLYLGPSFKPGQDFSQAFILSQEQKKG